MYSNGSQMWCRFAALALSNRRATSNGRQKLNYKKKMRIFGQAEVRWVLFFAVCGLHVIICTAFDGQAYHWSVRDDN